MPTMRTVRSAGLSESALTATVKLFRPDETQAVLDRFWENIPDDKDYTDEQKLEFAVCTYPDAGNHTADYLHRAIVMETAVGRAVQPTNPRGYAGAKPALWHRLERLDPETARIFIDAMRPHKHVPDRVLSNDMWVGLVTMMQFIDDLYRKHEDPNKVGAVLADDGKFLAAARAHAAVLLRYSRLALGG